MKRLFSKLAFLVSIIFGANASISEQSDSKVIYDFSNDIAYAAYKEHHDSMISQMLDSKYLCSVRKAELITLKDDELAEPKPLTIDELYEENRLIDGPKKIFPMMFLLNLKENFILNFKEIADKTLARPTKMFRYDEAQKSFVASEIQFLGPWYASDGIRHPITDTYSLQFDQILLRGEVTRLRSMYDKDNVVSEFTRLYISCNLTD